MVSGSLSLSCIGFPFYVQEALTFKKQLILLASYNVALMVTNNIGKWLLNVYIVFICTNRYSSMFLFP